MSAKEQEMFDWLKNQEDKKGPETVKAPETSSTESKEEQPKPIEQSTANTTQTPAVVAVVLTNDKKGDSPFVTTQTTTQTQTTVTPEEIQEEGTPIKEVYLLFGDKGVGKTTLAFSFPGVIACIGFDKKSAAIKVYRYKGDPRIHIFDATKYMDYHDQTAITKSADKTYDYIIAILKKIEKDIQPDWIVMDNSEIFHEICEWTMRYRHNIEAFAGFKELSLWKERRVLMRNIHIMAMDIAKKGIIYTTYQTKDNLVVDGELITSKDVPKWIDVLVYETDYVVHIRNDSDAFKVRVVTSKNDDKLPTGRIFDVTNKGLWEAVKK